ncbi:MAG: ABC transporter substrate-binding protein [Hyphomicrobiales bacterium]|nr:ABC transporter substrate-binding protein [Hyphomicrobiales bacterium]
MKLELSIAITSNPRTWPVIEGKVAPDAIDLLPTVLHPSELFWRQLRYAEFDVAEMSMSSLMMAVSKGDDRFVGIPVFTTRLFFHTTTLVRRAAGIKTPADLKGKRVGVPEYQQTAALWARGVMQHEFGVAPKDMEFWMERPPSRSHGGATGFTPPPGVTVNQIPPEKSIGSMMLAGELDAVMYYLVDPNLIDRSTVDLHSHPDIAPLFPDPCAEGVRYYRKTGLYPINHGMIIKRELAEQHPWAITNILKAFNRARDMAERQRMEHVAYHIDTGLLPASAREALRTPLLAHGIAANRNVLETIAQYSLEQGLTPRLMKLDELFAPSMMAQ